jgi:D-alanyl-D-alanine carboxypeptidase (penicillin-binding protein 5/6)
MLRKFKLPSPRWLGLAALGVVVLLAVNYLRPIPAISAVPTIRASSGGGSPATLPWPDRGQGAIGAEGAGVLAASPSAQPQPIASVAKVMTALVVVEARPLRKGESGPLVQVTADDVTTFQQGLANGESVVPVQAGEQLTEYQALQALLVPSGNNFATLLARWASGSVDAHLERMNVRAKELGMKRTRFADASGLSPDTVSVAADLVRLGEAAMQQEVLADIVSQPLTSLPVAGTVYNVNYVLNQSGIVGIKTGNILQAGACYLFAGTHQLPAGRHLLLFGAVMGLPTLDLAFSSAKALLQAMRTSLESRRIVARDQTVGRYEPPWGSGSDVVATDDLDILVWPGTTVRSTLRTRRLDGALPARSAVGRLHVTAADQGYDVPLVTTDEIASPGPFWRLTHLTF